MLTPQEERERVMESIIEKNRIADERYEREMAENNEAAEMEGYDREIEREEAAYEREQEAEASRVTPAEAIEMFTSPADEGGFADLWGHEPTRQKIVDAVDLAIAGGADNSDWRTYQRVGNRFRQRQKKLQSGQLDPNAVSREDVMNQLAAQQHREMIVGNAYCETESEPETPEQIRERFARDNPDLSGEEILDAAKAVDQAHREQYVKQGYSDNSYRTYEEAAEIARHQQVLRERNQE